MYHFRITDDVPATLELHSVPVDVQVWWDAQNGRTSDAPAPPGVRTRVVWRCEVYHVESNEVLLWDMPSTVHSTLRLATQLEPGLRFTVIRSRVKGRYVYAVTNVQPHKPAQQPAPAQPAQPAPAPVPAPVPSVLASADGAMPIAVDPGQLAQLVLALRQFGIKL